MDGVAGDRGDCRVGSSDVPLRATLSIYLTLAVIVHLAAVGPTADRGVRHRGCRSVSHGRDIQSGMLGPLAAVCALLQSGRLLVLLRKSSPLAMSVDPGAAHRGRPGVGLVVTMVATIAESDGKLPS